ncbi:uncharacterized protein G2W53_012949 [Senna tora]|uniref:Uncharacterized protein n=1 Tax=Senna tora TaxID=362788 RepID=A0A834WS10_9FABA|nr:uncharacterized protein G2W53_012949 [Senna tora]
MEITCEDVEEKRRHRRARS